SIIIFSFHFSSDHHYLHSFPTRRSSDLVHPGIHSDKHIDRIFCEIIQKCHFIERIDDEQSDSLIECKFQFFDGFIISMEIIKPRSEEHTSELQSRFDLVCRLLLEKKKK